MEGRADDRGWLSGGGGLAGPGGRTEMGMILGNPIAGRGATIGTAGIPIHHPVCENGTMARKTPFPSIPARRENPGYGPGSRASPPMGFSRGVTSLAVVERDRGAGSGSGIGERDRRARSKNPDGVSVGVAGVAGWSGLVHKRLNYGLCAALIPTAYPNNPCTALSGRVAKYDVGVPSGSV